MVQSLTLTEVCIQLKILPSLVYTSYTHRRVLNLPRKSKKMMEPIMKKHAIYGPGLRLVSVLHENGTVSDRYESNSCRVSDPHKVRLVGVYF